MGRSFIHSRLRAPRTLERSVTTVLLALVLLTPQVRAEPTPAPVESAPSVRLEPVIRGRLNEPVGIAFAPEEPNRLYLVEKGGRVRIAEGDRLLWKDLIDIEDLVNSSSALGLIGLAFPKDFKATRLAYVAYADIQGDLVIARFKSEEGVAAGVEEIKVILKVVQPRSNEHGGRIAFGPDGYLYVSTGSGGDAKGEDAYAQSRRSMLGKILRLDVSTAEAYRVPADNPFVGSKEAFPEIWAVGFHNPLTFSFDKVSGNMYAVDATPSGIDEINMVMRGRNYGWPILEGTKCSIQPCNPEEFQAPLVEYNRNEAGTIIGGVFYRGTSIPELNGSYILADRDSGRIWSLRDSPDSVSSSPSWQRRLLLQTNEKIAALGEAPVGEIYVIGQSGYVYRIAGTKSPAQ